MKKIKLFVTSLVLLFLFSCANDLTEKQALAYENYLSLVKYLESKGIENKDAQIAEFNPNDEELVNKFANADLDELFSIIDDKSADILKSKEKNKLVEEFQQRAEEISDKDEKVRLLETEYSEITSNHNKDI